MVEAHVGWKPDNKIKPCAVRSRELEPNLAYGGLGLAARGTHFGVAWHFATRSKTEGLVAFGGYDSQAGAIAQESAGPNLDDLGVKTGGKVAWKDCIKLKGSAWDFFFG